MAHLWISRKEDNVHEVKIFGIFSGVSFSMRQSPNSESLIAALQRTFEFPQDSLMGIKEELEKLIGNPKGSEYMLTLSPAQAECLSERDLK
jgi:hypothetical protein